MDNDDAAIGRVLSRREVLSIFGAAGAALLVACGGKGSPSTPSSVTGAAAAQPVTGAAQTSAVAAALPSCIVLPALTEGPYFVDEKLNRSDIRSDPGTGVVREGALLNLTFDVLGVSGASCSPLAGAMVDIWHCDALGVYSDVTDNMGGGFRTVGEKFLRGYQLTDGAGKAQFTTIYPGWYQGRATHIHFKIRKDNREFTSQFFFDDGLSDQINALAPYAQKGATGRLRNERDDIYRQSGGQLTLAVTKSGVAYAATFDIGMQA